MLAGVELRLEARPVRLPIDDEVVGGVLESIDRALRRVHVVEHPEPLGLFGGEGLSSQFRPQPPNPSKSPEKSQRRGRDSNPLDLGPEASRNGLDQAEWWIEGGTLQDETTRAEPELVDADAALKAAIKAAIDAGHWQRAEALLAVARARRT